MSTSTKATKVGWRLVKFGDVVRLSKERSQDPLAEGFERYVGLEHLEPGDLRVRTWGKVSDGVSFTSVFHAGQVLFGKRRAYQRKIAVPDFGGVCSGDIYVLESKDANVLLPELLRFICQTDAFFEHAIGTSAGSLSPRTNWTSLANFEFSLPSIAEQIRITNLIQLADAYAETVLEAIKSLGQLKRAFAVHAFRKGLNNHATSPSSVHFKELPLNWKAKPLGEVFNLLDQRRIPIKDSDRSKRKGKYPYYGASGIIDYIDDFIFDEPILLLAEDGMNLIFRSSPLVYKVSDRCWVNNHAHVLQPTNHADIDFFAEYLESISFEPFITGTYQKKITKADCSRIPLPVPPMDEQKEIAEIFASINRQFDSLSMRHAAAKTLLKTLRESALEGEHV